MISVDEATKIIMENTDTMKSEEIYYLDALNRICASDIIARDPLPPFAASVKDGFALKLTTEQKEFIKTPKNNKPLPKFIFQVIGSSNAGDDALTRNNLQDGQCVKINTGAPVPKEADLVIQIEDTIAVEKDSNGLDLVIEVVSTSGCGGQENVQGHIDIKLGQDIRLLVLNKIINEFKKSTEY